MVNRRCRCRAPEGAPAKGRIFLSAWRAGTGAVVEVVYGRTPQARLQVARLTRSMLGQLAFQIEAPEQDIARGWTGPGSPPDNAFVAVEYQHVWFWVERYDFDSKLAFSVVNILLALAKVSAAPGAVVTVPVR